MNISQNRWFRAERSRAEIDQLLDLYWGGKERRITTLTLKIMGINMIAVLMLVFGVVYLSQYHTIFVKAKLEHLESEIVMVTTAIADSGMIQAQGEGKGVSEEKAVKMAAKMALTLGKRILLFDEKGEMILDSKMYIRDHIVTSLFQVSKEPPVHLNSVEMLKNMASWIISLFPKYEVLPLYEGVRSDKAQDYRDARDALNKNFSISAWRAPEDEKQLVLTAAIPVLKGEDVVGVVMMISDGNDIREAVGGAWFDILKLFFLTLAVTVFLSIYLSGVIARPLRKLAVVAENVRKGRANYTDIPDMSARNDEIGELSLALREMTYALWVRMDTIEAFASDVAHEIKNPLTSLKSAVEAASVVKKKKDLDRLLSVIKDDTERLDRLITDISLASRLDAELSREGFERVDLKKLFRGLLELYRAPLERLDSANDESIVLDYEGVCLRLEMPEQNNLYVYGSYGRLVQVFQNIIANALSFSPKKGCVRVRVAFNDRRIHIIIEDDGVGIPENQLENIFTRFYSERPKGEKYGDHSGLGLSICKQIISAHNGVIYAENKRDEEGCVIGARFVVILNVIEL